MGPAPFVSPQAHPDSDWNTPCPNSNTIWNPNPKPNAVYERWLFDTHANHDSNP